MFTLLLGLAARNSPERLRILPVSGKGNGFPYHYLAGLPHIERVYSIDSDNIETLIPSVREEMARRREILSRANCQSINELWMRDKTGSELIPPAWVLVFEEWSYLEHDTPGIEDEITRIALQGAALGIQVVVGAQMPSRLARFPAHTKLAMRMFNSHDAAEFAGMPVAVPYIPGRGVLVRANEAVTMQVAQAEQHFAETMIAAMARASTYRLT